jgi:16S rRNA (guanine966-N2)-methyltransferase
MRAVPGIRVLGGALRGRRLRVPQGARPTEGRVREALASIWSGEIAGAEFLDLFAGSGAMGIEALSRGALRAVFVESSASGRRDLEHNLKELGLTAAGRVIGTKALEALEALAVAGERFDLIFADPPYAWTPPPELFPAVERLLAPAGAFALEHSARFPTPAERGGLVRTDQRRYGESALSFYGRSA